LDVTKIGEIFPLKEFQTSKVTIQYWQKADLTIYLMNITKKIASPEEEYVEIIVAKIIYSPLCFLRFKEK